MIKKFESFDDDVNLDIDYSDFEVLATNESYWSWEYDSSTITARILKNNDDLYLDITKIKSKTGIGAGKKKTKLAFVKIGNTKKADLALVRSYLKKYKHENSSAGYSFSKHWEDDEGNKMTLSDLLSTYKPEKPIRKPKKLSKIKSKEDFESDIELVKYSDYSYALFGDGTRAIKDELKKYCKYNRFLTDPKTGLKRPGWIFSAKKLDDVKKIIKKELN